MQKSKYPVKSKTTNDRNKILKILRKINREVMFEYNNKTFKISLVIVTRAKKIEGKHTGISTALSSVYW